MQFTFNYFYESIIFTVNQLFFDENETLTLENWRNQSMTKLEVPEFIVEWDEHSSIKHEDMPFNPQYYTILLKMIKAKNFMKLIITAIGACCLLFMLNGFSLQKEAKDFSIPITNNFIFEVIDQPYTPLSEDDFKCIYSPERNSITPKDANINKLRTVPWNSLSPLLVLAISDQEKSHYLVTDITGNLLYSDLDNLATIGEGACFPSGMIEKTIFWNLTESKELHFITSQARTVIDTHVTNFIESRNGFLIYYIKQENDRYHLFQYNYSTDVSKLISSNVNDKNYCISPDGKCVVYQNYEDNGNLQCYLYEEGKEQVKLSDGIIPIAFSNTFLLFYYWKDDKLYVQTQTDCIELKKDAVDNFESIEFIFNDSYTKLHYKSGGIWYQSDNGRRNFPIIGPEEDGKIIKRFNKETHTPRHNVKVISNFSGINDLRYSSTSDHYRIQDSTQYSDGIVYENYFLCLMDQYITLFEYTLDNKTTTKILSNELTFAQILPCYGKDYFYAISTYGDLFQMDYTGQKKLLSTNIVSGYQTYMNGEQRTYFSKPLEDTKDSNPNGLNRTTNITISDKNYEFYYASNEILIPVKGPTQAIMISPAHPYLFQDATENDTFYFLQNDFLIEISRDINDTE